MAPIPDTRESLLVRLSSPADEAAWTEFIAVYEDAVFRYCRSRGLQNADAREVVQDVLLLVHQRIGQWTPSKRRYSFRTWLFRTAHYHCLAVIRDRSKNGTPVGGTSSYQRLQDVAELPDDVLLADLEWKRWAFHWASEQIRHEVQSTTWRAFWLTAVDAVPAEDVAKSLGIRIGTVYTSRCRVLSQIRERIQTLTRSEA